MFHASLAACFGVIFPAVSSPAHYMNPSAVEEEEEGTSIQVSVRSVAHLQMFLTSSEQHLRRLFPSPHIVSRTWRPDELEPSVLSYKAEQNVQPGPLVRSHLQYNDWRLPQLRNYEVPCDAEWIWGLVPPWTTFTGHGWQLGVLSQRVNTRPVSGARFSPSLLLTHFSFHPL